MHFPGIFLLIILFFNKIEELPANRKMFVSPLKTPVLLSANFGELRSDHFHSGLDIKTQGVIGKEVVAAASGYIYRISISSSGFGKTLYMRHPSGYSTVYAHLDRFIPEIEEYVVARQYEKKSFSVNIFPPKNRFTFDQHDLIAYSGNSGSSTGPHLHFEIRKSDNEEPLNPLLFELGIEDNIKPVIERLVVYPVKSNSYVNNQNKPFQFSVTGSKGNYHLTNQRPINISGAAGFGIKSFDLLNNSHNKCGIYSITLEVDSNIVYVYKMDRFSFSEYRYINSHIDYEILMKEKIYVEKLFLQPNNRLRSYRDVVNNGIVTFDDGRKHFVRIIVTDKHNNESTLSFNVNSVSQPEVARQKEENHYVVMPYSRNNRFVTDKVMVNIPAGTLYDTLFFEYSKSARKRGMLSEAHQIHNRFTPVHKSYSLSIKPDTVLPGKEDQMLIVQTNLNGKDIPLRTSWNNGLLTANPMSLGTFYIGIDTVSPAITPIGFAPDSDLSSRKDIKFRISDSFSGIRTYEPSIDGKWALFEYDQKNNLLIYRFDPKRITKGTRHNLVLKVTDNAGNLSTFKSSFNW